MNDMSALKDLKIFAYASIEDRYKCAHEEREIRRRIIANGHISYVYQCANCGHTSSPISAKMALSLSPSPPAYNPHIQQLRREEKHQEYLQAYLAIRPKLAAAYQDYLSSSAWFQRRNEAMQRTNSKCEICGEIAVDVHHLTYRNIGQELPEELMPVCRLCHEVIHGRANA